MPIDKLNYRGRITEIVNVSFRIAASLNANNKELTC
jgi:hypothetical protein